MNSTWSSHAALRFVLVAMIALASAPAWLHAQKAARDSSQRENASGKWIVQAGKANAVIVTPADAPRTVQMAARELQQVIEKMTGATLPITDKPAAGGGVSLYVGQSDALASLGVHNDGLKHGAFKLVSGDNWLAFVGADRDFKPIEPWGHDHRDADRVLAQWDAITGDYFGNPFTAMWRKVDQRESGMWEFDLDNAGSFQAVTHFLRGLGCRWYMPGELGQFIPRRDDLALPSVDITVTPDFSLRNIYQMGSNFFTRRQEEIRWQLQLGTNQGMDLVAFGPNVSVAHGIKRVIDRDMTRQQHPDMYRLIGGRRQTQETVPCLSSEKLIAAQVKYLRNLFDHYDVPMASVMPTDGFSRMCECDLCKGQATPERGRGGQLSDYVWSYVVRVANELAKTHPDRKIHCLAYTTYRLPPVKIDKLPSNVVVGIAQNRSYFRMPEQEKLMHDIRAAWQEKITSGVPIYQYEYYLQQWPSRPTAGLPAIYPRLIARDLRYLQGQSLGEYIEAYRLREPEPISLLNIYVTARLMWEVDLDLDAMLDEYYQLMYDQARVPMQAFYELAEQTWFDMQETDIHKLRALLDEAHAMAGDTDARRRIELVRKSLKKGFDRRLAAVRKPATILLPAFDTQGLDADADMSLLPSRQMVDIVTGRVPEQGQSAQVQLGWTGQGLAVRVSCQESDMSLVRAAAPANHDASIFLDDIVVISIMAGEDVSREIVINSRGMWAGVDRSRQGLDGLGWDARIKPVTSLDEKQWTMEVIIELEALDAALPTEAQPWHLNVARSKLRQGERFMAALAATGEQHPAVPQRMLNMHPAAMETQP